MSQAPVRPWGPDPSALTTAGQLRECLNALYMWSGRPQYRRLAVIAGTSTKVDHEGNVVLNPRTGRPIEHQVLGPGRISELLRDRNDHEPPPLRHLEAFVRACLTHAGCAPELIAEALDQWRAAWHRIATGEPRGTVPGRGTTSISPALVVAVLAASAVLLGALFTALSTAWPAWRFVLLGAVVSGAFVAVAAALIRRARLGSGRTRENAPRSPQSGAGVVRQQAQPLNTTEVLLYELRAKAAPGDRRIGIVTGDIRRIRFADIWVNPENTGMKMPRVEEFSTSAIIRFEGSRRDHTGRIVDDCIADELARKIAERAPVTPGTAIVTGAGELTSRNGVRNVIHVAAVQGEPGAGYRQVSDIGRCVTNVLVATEQQIGAPGGAGLTILFPLLGTGVGGGELGSTVQAMLGAATDHLFTERRSCIRTILFQAYTDVELAVGRAVFDANPRLRRVDQASAR